MRVLIDECLPRRLRRVLSTHVVLTAQQAGWAGVSNGSLSSRAASQFDAFITIDKNLPAQQNHVDLPVAVIVIHARSNRFHDIEPLVPAILAALEHLQPKSIVHVPS